VVGWRPAAAERARRAWVRGGDSHAQAARDEAARSVAESKLARRYPMTVWSTRQRQAQARVPLGRRPGSGQTFPRWAVLLQKAGRHAEAAEVYGALVQLRPLAEVWWMGLGISLEASGQSQEAVKAYRQAADKPDMTPALDRFVSSRLEALKAAHS
jgi:Flp pilus assembly protein TadD